jgi:ribonuclease G
MGTPKDAFLHFSDVGENLENYIKKLNGDDAVDKAIAFNKEMNKRYGGSKEPAESMTAGVEKQMRAGEVLQPGQKLLVQIVKEPIGSKGPRVSTDITIAGRFVVLIPMGDYVAVSKRIRSFKERRRLRNIVSSKMPDGFGIIVRTVAQNQPDKVLIEDVEDVLNKWQKILGQIKTAKPPQLLYRDLDMTESLIRDLFAKDYNQVLIDDPEIYKEVKNSVSRWAPEMVPNIKLYKGKEHIFDYMRVSADVESVFSPRVKMPSGGYLIFEQTEAMFVVDVNSGRYAAKRHQEENSLKTNLEAAREIAKQLRLRDIGGIIVVDFIDLKDDVNRKKVYDELKKEFRKDKAKTNVLPMSDFGLVQITRQRIRPSVVTSVSKVCPMCGGTGEMVSQNTVLADIEAWLSKYRHTYKKRSVDVYLNPFLSSFVTRGLISEKLKWMFKFGMKINVMNDETQSMNDYRFTMPGSDVDITETVMQDRPLEAALKESQEELLRLTSESKMDRSKLDVFDKKNDRNAPKGSKYRDLDEEFDDDDDDSDDDHSYEVEHKPRKVINPKEKYFKKEDEQIPSKQESTPTSKTEETPSYSRAESYSNLRQALDVAREYAEKHNIEVKLVSDDDDYDDEEIDDVDVADDSIETGTPKLVKVSDRDTDDDDSDDDDEYESDDDEEDDDDSDDEDEYETDDDDDSDDADTQAEIEGVSVKSSIQFVETEDEDTVELEIFKETVEVLEKEVAEVTEKAEASPADESEEAVADEEMEIESQPTIESKEDTSDDEVETSEEPTKETAPKKKRGRKPIMVSKKTTPEPDSPKKIIQSTVKAKKTEEELALDIDQVESVEETPVAEKVEKKSSAAKKAPAKSTKKGNAKASKKDENAPAGLSVISSIVAEVVKEKEKAPQADVAKEQPKIRVSTTTKSTKAAKASEDAEPES